jgi:hypothetical protein
MVPLRRIGAVGSHGVICWRLVASGSQKMPVHSCRQRESNQAHTELRGVRSECRGADIFDRQHPARWSAHCGAGRDMPPGPDPTMRYDCSRRNSGRTQCNSAPRVTPEGTVLLDCFSSRRTGTGSWPHCRYAANWRKNRTSEVRRRNGRLRDRFGIYGGGPTDDAIGTEL